MNNQQKSVDDDRLFLKDSEVCSAMPQTAMAVKARLDRNERYLAQTVALVTEIRKAIGSFV